VELQGDFNPDDSITETELELAIKLATKKNPQKPTSRVPGSFVLICRVTSNNTHFIIFSSRVRPCRVRPVRWQIKDCQTTEPRTFDSGFSGKVNLLTLGFYGTPTYLLTTQCVPYYLVRGYPLSVQPSLTLPL
jgi:hypothetical protein